MTRIVRHQQEPPDVWKQRVEAQRQAEKEADLRRSVGLADVEPAQGQVFGSLLFLLEENL